MVPVDPGSVRELLEALIAGFSVLGGGMAVLSGSYAATAMAQEQSAEVISQRVNEGIGTGFVLFRWMSIGALIIMAWT